MQTHLVLARELGLGEAAGLLRCEDLGGGGQDVEWVDEDFVRQLIVVSA